MIPIYIPEQTRQKQNMNTKDIEESWWDKFWELVDASENYITVDERITAREKLEQLVTQHHQAEVERVRNEAIKECEERIQLSIGDWAWDNCNEEADVFTARPSDLLGDIEEITTRPLPRADITSDK